jgi:hypothetical protein
VEVGELGEKLGEGMLEVGGWRLEAYLMPDCGGVGQYFRDWDIIHHDSRR